MRNILSGSIDSYKKNVRCISSGSIPVENGILEMHWIVCRPVLAIDLCFCVVFTKIGSKDLIKIPEFMFGTALPHDTDELSRFSFNVVSNTSEYKIAVFEVKSSIESIDMDALCKEPEVKAKKYKSL